MHIEILTFILYNIFMKITIFNFKGGQGKTTISLALALSYGFFIITNDEYSPINKILLKGHAKHLKQGEKLPNVPDDLPVIYDFNLCSDERIIEALNLSSWVIIPLVYDSPLDMQVTIKTIREIEQHNKKILIILNKSKKGDFEKANKVLNNFFNYPILELKQSTAFIKIIEKKKSLQKLMEENKLLENSYKKPVDQLQAIKNFIS